MKKTKLTSIYIGIAACSLVACTSETGSEPPGGGLHIAVHTRTASKSGGESESSARLLFWSDEVFHNEWMDKSISALPSYSTLLDKEINHYTYEGKIYYETPYIYPPDFGKIHATGYAPDNALSPSEGKGLTELTVNKGYMDGSTDLLTCDGCLAHSGSMNPGNTFLEKEKELVFRHLTAKLTFLGTREREMIGTIGVRNIRITVNKPSDNSGKIAVPAKLALYTEKSTETGGDYTTYIISETAPYPYGRTMIHKPIIPPDETVTLGTCYAVSEGLSYGSEGNVFDPIKGEWVGTALTGKPKLGITITAELYDARQDNPSGTSYEDTWIINEIDTWNINTGDKFLPGYEYTITIRFNRTGISLKAEAAPWNSEQLHEYPIFPLYKPH